MAFCGEKVLRRGGENLYVFATFITLISAILPQKESAQKTNQGVDIMPIPFIPALLGALGSALSAAGATAAATATAAASTAAAAATAAGTAAAAAAGSAVAAAGTAAAALGTTGMVIAGVVVAGAIVITVVLLNRAKLKEELAKIAEENKQKKILGAKIRENLDEGNVKIVKVDLFGENHNKIYEAEFHANEVDTDEIYEGAEITLAN